MSSFGKTNINFYDIIIIYITNDNITLLPTSKASTQSVTTHSVTYNKDIVK